jgi:cell wall-associated NlpC family hydrolase
MQLEAVMASGEIVRVAKTWIGTPWRHNQRAKGLGVDCVRFIEAVASEALGITLPEISNYQRLPEGNAILDFMNELEFLESVAIADRRDGDVLLFRIGKIPHHCGFSVGDGMIHADVNHGVIQVSNLANWQRRLIRCFRVRG